MGTWSLQNHSLPRQDRIENKCTLFSVPLQPCGPSAGKLGSAAPRVGLWEGAGIIPRLTVVTPGGQMMGSPLKAAAPSASSRGDHQHRFRALHGAAPSKVALTQVLAKFNSPAA